MNMTNINPQLLTIEAAVTCKKEYVYQAAMLDPHTAAELSLDDIIKMCDELIEAHEKAGYPVF
jgi:alpha-galactosidase